MDDTGDTRSGDGSRVHAFGNDGSRVHAFGDDALGTLDAVGLAAEIRARRVSAREATDAAIRRAELVDPRLGAIACADFDGARRAADAGRDGTFAGVPTFIKDNVDVAGLPTQQGSAAFRARPASAYGAAADAFLRMGPVNLGKSQLSEFGISPSAESPGREVRNPWDTAYSSGASSAGSAALVAAGAVPFAHGNDGGGSLRIPAAACGLVGFKPSRGRVPQDAMFRRMPVRVVCDGVLTRTVRDTAAYLRRIDQAYPRRALLPIGPVDGPPRRPLRIGVVFDSPAGRTDAQTRAAVAGAVSLLEELGHHVEEAKAPVSRSFVDDFTTYYGLMFLYLNATGKRTFNDTFDWHDTESLTRGFAAHTLRRAPRLPGAIARLRTSAARTRALYARFDAVLTPTVSHVTPRIGHLDPTLPFDEVMERILAWVGFTPLQNATGEPAVSVPFGLSDEGVPIGVQFGAPLGAEALLLQLAYAVEEARPFPRIGGQGEGSGARQTS